MLASQWTPVLRRGIRETSPTVGRRLSVPVANVRMSSHERPVNGRLAGHAATLLRRLLLRFVAVGGGSSLSSARSRFSWCRSRSLIATSRLRTHGSTVEDMPRRCEDCGYEYPPEPLPPPPQRCPTAPKFAAIGVSRRTLDSRFTPPCPCRRIRRLTDQGGAKRGRACLRSGICR
jgi:hypothetical protein